jgi:D-beta-D-heptose 7-phosphate kinase/D-beta-D-heptose 1-phosphate adenosyltransferase
VLDPPRARALLDCFPGRRILVIGDVMLDHFLVGRVHRISPEAPVPVVKYSADEYRLGGAANVAHLVTALGGRARLVGVVGADEAGRRLSGGLAGIGVEPGGLVTDANRRTTTKIRIVTERRHQVARVDYEDDGLLSGEVEREACRRIRQAAVDAHVILISDYLKGSITPGVAACAIAEGRERGIPILVDPKIPHLARYRGATLVTPNQPEAEAATHLRIRASGEAGPAARAFADLAGCTSVLITLGDQGMWLLERREDAAGPLLIGEALLPALAREVADVTGAGDTVIGTMAMGLAAGGTLLEAAHLANHAAGVAVGKFGAATVSRQELLEAIERDAQA